MERSIKCICGCRDFWVNDKGTAECQKCNTRFMFEKGKVYYGKFDRKNNLYIEWSPINFSAGEEGK